VLWLLQCCLVFKGTEVFQVLIVMQMCFTKISVSSVGPCWAVFTPIWQNLRCSGMIVSIDSLNIPMRSMTSDATHQALMQPEHLHCMIWHQGLSQKCAHHFKTLDNERVFFFNATDSHCQISALGIPSNYKKYNDSVILFLPAPLSLWITIKITIPVI
jgi:hypothetical protein